MIEEIRITSLGVIDESVLELGDGLTVITGETGAGKTMLVTALGLLLGGRADAGAVRTGARAARVEGVVRADPGVAAIADEHGGEVESGRLLLGRQVSARGTLARLPRRRLGPCLGAVPGRGLPWWPCTASPTSTVCSAPRPSATRSTPSPAPSSPRCWRATGPGSSGCVRSSPSCARCSASARERAREADVLRLGLEEIEAVDPQPGEEHALAVEESRLGFADTLRTSAETAREALSSDQDAPDALGAVAAARRALEGVREHDPEVAALADRVAEVSYLLADVAADVASYSAGVETDPARLAAVSERRAALSTLTRKYGETVEEVLEWSRVAAERLSGLDGSEERVAAAACRPRATCAVRWPWTPPS